ncbi:NifB/NifX family molybdenum-iron cluster-binding protein [Halanaerobium praevalens]|uniref:Dinitrogenase iron-molybdenum cofactor biosynthesis protein n=1 Tax=Halanaerobium praevalens (strain ATCC 33744 / DSM 2228 / GSL) TaxID=572479 RepID=E3DNM5_HALPG|nr:NifB/NifX family molybdenum-iron cluster-binding protein [Halanaerobium praevalens]ADO77575.1 Dinitrogenase iron-molybdenum cofactor biosynthesis protein [Halanaerobium praevalens DSM 2228]
MKIIIPAVEFGDLKSKIHANFGRANYFALINSENDQVEFIKNEAAAKKSGAGIAAAQLCADQGVDLVTAYHFGPKATKALKTAGIKMLELEDQKLIKDVYNEPEIAKIIDSKK